MTSQVRDLMQLKEFIFIIYPKVDLFFIIYHLTYLILQTFLTNFLFQSFQLIYINGHTICL